MKYWVGMSSALALGGLIGFAVGVISVDEKYKKQYIESTASMRRAVELAQDLPETAFGPADTEEELGEYEGGSVEFRLLHEGPGIGEWQGEVVNVGGVQDKPVAPDTNPYHTAVQALDTPQELFIEGAINDYGVSYIEEEEYEEEDGRTKYRVDYFPGDTGAVFMMGGQVLEDWAERLGDSIIVDFFRFIPTGAEPILYVRNHKTEEDYEVVQGNP